MGHPGGAGPGPKVWNRSFERLLAGGDLAAQGAQFSECLAAGVAEASTAGPAAGGTARGRRRLLGALRRPDGLLIGWADRRRSAGLGSIRRGQRLGRRDRRLAGRNEGFGCLDWRFGRFDWRFGGREGRFDCREDRFHGLRRLGVGGNLDQRSRVLDQSVDLIGGHRLLRESRRRHGAGLDDRWILGGEEGHLHPDGRRGRRPGSSHGLWFEKARGGKGRSTRVAEPG